MDDRPSWTIRNRDLLDAWLAAERDPEVRAEVSLWVSNLELDPYSAGGEPIPAYPDWVWSKIEVRSRGGRRLIGVIWRLGEPGAIYLAGPPGE